VIISALAGHVLRGLHMPIDIIVADGHGGWFVASTGIRRVRRDGRVDATWHSPVRRTPVLATNSELTRHGDRLYFAARQRVAAVDAATGRVLWLSPTVSGPRVAGFRASIFAVAAGSRDVYLGGTFTAVGGARRVGLAALDAATGRLLPWQAAPAPNVALLALSSSTLYFSGSFGVRGVRASDGGPTGFRDRGEVESPAMLAVWHRFVLFGCNPRVGACGGSTGVVDGRTGNPVHKYAFDEVLAAGAVDFDGPIAYLGTGAEGDFGGNTHLIAIDMRTGRYERWWFPKPGAIASSSSITVSGDNVFAAGTFCPAS
jgi:hypothetical protein